MQNFTPLRVDVRQDTLCSQRRCRERKIFLRNPAMASAELQVQSTLVPQVLVDSQLGSFVRRVRRPIHQGGVVSMPPMRWIMRTAFPDVDGKGLALELRGPCPEPQGLWWRSQINTLTVEVGSRAARGAQE